MIEGNQQYKSLKFNEGHASQIEVMGILKNASNLYLAEMFLEFSLTENFQKHIPQGNWMYPVIDLRSSQKDFYSAAPLPISLEQIFPSSEQKDNWIENWEKSIIE